jgi:hypothetical protein
MTELVTITPPDETKLTAAFDALPDDLKSRLEAKFAPLIDALLTSVEAGEPTPKTGGLRGATHAFSYLRARSVGGGVAIGPESSEPFNLKAAALEHGSHKLIDMAGHAMRLDHFMNKQIEPMTVFVNAYTRRHEHPGPAFHAGCAGCATAGICCCGRGSDFRDGR